jgi:iron complex transport system substrate-binding protein
MGLASAPAIALALLVATGCSRKAATTDAGATARRIVSLSPSTTEALFAVGAKDNVVGRSRYCDFPQEALALPQVGGFSDPNLEAILALKPDLVVGAHGPIGVQFLQRLNEHGIPGFFPETESLVQIDAMVTEMGARTGHGADAAQVVNAMHTREAAIEGSVKGLPRPRALLVFGLSPIVAAGPGSFSSEMLNRAGGDNAVREGGFYPVLGMEQVLALDPDVVINAALAEAHGAERIHREAPGWSALRAVKNGRVVSIADESVLRPGPRVGDALALFARALHPEAKVP